MEASEIVALTRDIVFLVLVTVALLAILLLYRKISAVLDSARRTIKQTENIVTTVSGKVVGPAAAGSGIAFGAGKLAAFLGGFAGNKRKGGKNNGE